jgi:fatty acid desaturase
VPAARGRDGAARPPLNPRRQLRHAAQGSLQRLVLLGSDLYDLPAEPDYIITSSMNEEAEHSGTVSGGGGNIRSSETSESGRPIDLPPDARATLVALSRRDNWRNFVYLAEDWACVVAAATVTTAAHGKWLHAIIYVIALLLIGSRQRALANLFHEASHLKLFRSRVLNNWICYLLISFPMAASLSSYLPAHRRHHSRLWADADPELAKYEALGLKGPEPSLTRALVRHALRPLLLVHVPASVGASIRDLRHEVAPERTVRIVGTIAAVGLASYSPHFRTLLAYYWVIPYLTSYQVIRYWAEVAEHGGMKSSNALHGTRNWTSGPLTRWLIGSHSDDLYHLVHHLYPAIPHHRLARAHRVLFRASPSYRAAQARRCNGFFFRRLVGVPSVMSDIAGGYEFTLIPLATARPRLA